MKLIPPPGKTQTGTSLRLIRRTSFLSGEKRMPATLFGLSMWKRIAKVLISLTLFTGCYKDHLYVQQEWVDRNFLASTHVGSPDPRQECPPCGERILVAWKFPRELFCQNLRLELTVRFWDQSEEVLITPVEKPWQYHAYNFFNQKILTYKIDVINKRDEIVETWEHQFWTKIIEISLK